MGWEARIWDKMIENSPRVCALQPGASRPKSNLETFQWRVNMAVVETASSLRILNAAGMRIFAVDSLFEAWRDITLRLTKSVAVPNSGQ
jgi:hypothetical protein